LLVEFVVIIVVSIEFIFLNKLKILTKMELIFIILFFSVVVLYIWIIKFIVKNIFISGKLVWIWKIFVERIILFFFTKFLLNLRTVLIFKIIFRIFKLIHFLLLSKLPLFSWVLGTWPRISRMIILIVILSKLLLLKFSS
jgi:hypothetical protein